MPMPSAQVPTSTVPTYSSFVDTVISMDLLIGNEIMMSHGHSPEAVRRTICDVESSTKLFFAKFVPLFGDFVQLLLVTRTIRL